MSDLARTDRHELYLSGDENGSVWLGCTCWWEDRLDGPTTLDEITSAWERHRTEVEA